MEDIDPRRFELAAHIVDRIEEHERYGPLLSAAAREQASLILDYHSHEASAYCVAIRRAEPDSEELAHVAGVGKHAHECEVTLALLAAELVRRYDLREVPLPYLDGRPYAGPASPR